MTARPQESLDTYVREGNIAAYDVSVVPDVFKKQRGRAKVFSRKPTNGTLRYVSVSELREERADVYFLDRSATKVLLADFPATARYVLIRLIPRLSWLVAIPGLLRRVQKGLVSIEGIHSLPAGARTGQWLVLRHNLTESLHTRLSLSEEVGVQGFLAYLRTNKVDGVVLRFFEHLPDLARAGGDIDLLVSDTDERTVKGFLQENPGPIGIDVWTVSRATFNDITYYPPPLARAILASAVDGPAGSRVPAPREAFLSLVYHVLYHKGLFAGVPTNLPGLTTNPHPENDYAGAVARMAEALGVQVDITMEALDEYLEQEGWRPKIDTLAKIATRNRWVWKRFFSQESSEEVGLGVFIVKQKALSRLAEIVKTIEGSQAFAIVRTATLDAAGVARVAKDLRGGVWTHESGGPDEYLPAAVIVVLDLELVRAHPVRGIKRMKNILRKAFDQGGGSVVHSTDNSTEAWDYIHSCFPEEQEALKHEIHARYESIRLSVIEQVRLRAAFIPRYVTYRLSIMRRRLKDALIRWLLA